MNHSFNSLGLGIVVGASIVLVGGYFWVPLLVRKSFVKHQQAIAMRAQGGSHHLQAAQAALNDKKDSSQVMNV